MEPTVEHRKHQRYLVRFNSIFSTDGVHIKEGLVLDLSLGGCRLTSAIHVPAGIPIEMHIAITNPFMSPSRCTWEGNSVFGLEFKEVPELESATLTRLLWSLRSEGRMVHGISLRSATLCRSRLPLDETFATWKLSRGSRKASNACPNT